MHRHHRALAAVLRRLRGGRYDGETAVCGTCGTCGTCGALYFKRDGHSC